MESRATTDPELAPAEAKVPRPLAGGSYSVESLGRIVDRLLGDRRANREAAARLERLLVKQENMPEDPEPVAVPEPVPGGTEDATRGTGENAEHR